MRTMQKMEGCITYDRSICVPKREHENEAEKNKKHSHQRPQPFQNHLFILFELLGIGLLTGAVCFVVFLQLGAESLAKPALFECLVHRQLHLAPYGMGSGGDGVGMIEGSTQEDVGEVSVAHRSHLEGALTQRGAQYSDLGKLLKSPVGTHTAHNRPDRTS